MLCKLAVSGEEGTEFSLCLLPFFRSLEWEAPIVGRLCMIWYMAQPHVAAAAAVTVMVVVVVVMPMSESQYGLGGCERPWKLALSLKKRHTSKCKR